MVAGLNHNPMNFFSKSVLLIGLVGLILLFFFTKEEELTSRISPTSEIKDNTEEKITENTTKRGIDENIGKDSLRGIISDNKAIMIFESSSDAGKAHAVIEQLLVQGKKGLAKTLLRELDERCGGKDDIVPMPDTPKWVVESVLNYCDDYDSTVFRDLNGDRESFYIKNPAISSLISSEETDIDVVSSDFLNMLTDMSYSSNSFMAEVADTIGHFSSELVPLNLGQSQNISSYEVGTLQIVATELYACERFGGCGPRSHQVLSYCFMDVRCQEGWSLMDYYQNTLSPVGFNEIMNMLSEIRSYEGRNKP